MPKHVKPRKSKYEGEAYTPEMKVWTGMVARCTSPDNPAWSDYGGRGITVCELWCNSYEAFLKDMGRRPCAGYEIDRKDNNAGYSPDNCHWVTQKQNARNRRSNRIVTLHGVSMCLAEACEKAGMSYSLVSKRLSKKHVNNWPGETALTTPAQPKAEKGSTTRPTAIPMTNKTGLKGVKNRREGFIGRVLVGGKRFYSPQFSTAQEAYKWYLAHKQPSPPRAPRSCSLTKLHKTHTGKTI